MLIKVKVGSLFYQTRRMFFEEYPFLDLTSLPRQVCTFLTFPLQ